MAGGFSSKWRTMGSNTNGTVDPGTSGGGSDAGTGGGMIYALTTSNANEVRVLDVQMKGQDHYVHIKENGKIGVKNEQI